MDPIWILLGLILVLTGSTAGLLWCFGASLFYAIIPLFAILLIVYVILPLIFRSSKAVQRHFVYQHRTHRLPSDADLLDPASFGIVGCRNLYLTLRENHFIGVWHLVPQNLIKKAHSKKSTDAFWDRSLRSSEKPIIIYFHGNTGTRALDHRRELYWLLQSDGYHVIAFDYRGFGDSSSIDINEETTVEDGVFVYAWLSNLLSEGQQLDAHPHNRILVWGHSLGTAIASSTIARLLNRTPAALILESPFTNIGEAMQHHRKAKLHRFLPYFHWLFTDALKKNGIHYATDLNLIAFHKVPVLILHAHDDETVPIKLGFKLAEIANQGRKNANGWNGGGSVPVPAPAPVFITDLAHGHGHKYICKYPGLLAAVNNFLKPISTYKARSHHK